MRWHIWVVCSVLLLLVPNLLWLGTSTVRVHNSSNQDISGLGYMACERTHVTGHLRPGESVFRILEGCGDDTLEIAVGGHRFCRTYVEDELYHVDVTFNAETSVTCEYEDPLSSLFVVKVFW